MKDIRQAEMKDYTSFRAGGRADRLVIPESRDELRQILSELAASGEEYMVMGNGTNILVKDGGYRGTIVRIGEALSAVRTEGEELIAESGALLSVVAAEALRSGLSGLEFAAGIPGSVGGAAFINAGAYDGEMKQVVKEVELMARDGSGTRTAAVGEMDYGYRHSALYESGEIVLSVRFALTRADQAEIEEKMRDLAGRRSDKQPLNYPSAGSFFKRPPGHFAGRLIEDAGLKGLRAGGAMISEKHAGFLINTGGATAGEIVSLMRLVQGLVKDRFGVDLEPEVRIIGEDAPSERGEPLAGGQD